MARLKRRHLVDAAIDALTDHGYQLKRVPGRGLSNMWYLTKDGETMTAAIRTTQDRWFAFPPEDNGAKWSTLDDVELVVVCAVDSRENPKALEVYLFPATEVRKRFDSAYKARVSAGQTVSDHFGMWVGLDFDTRKIAASVGSGIIDNFGPIARYPINATLNQPEPEVSNATELQPKAAPTGNQPTIAEAMAQARNQIAQIAGVNVEAVRLDLKIEY